MAEVTRVVGIPMGRDYNVWYDYVDCATAAAWLNVGTRRKE